MYTQRWLMKKKVRERSLAGTFREGVHVWPWFESLSNCSSSLGSAAGMWLALRGNRLGDPTTEATGGATIGGDRCSVTADNERKVVTWWDQLDNTMTPMVCFEFGLFLHSCSSVHYLMASLEREGQFIIFCVAKNKFYVVFKTSSPLSYCMMHPLISLS